MQTAAKDVPNIHAARLATIAAEVNTLKVSAADRRELIGVKLREAKSLCGHGHFNAWVKENCGFAKRTAQNYMDDKKAKLALLDPYPSKTRYIKEIAKLCPASGGGLQVDAVLVTLCELAGLKAWPKGEKDSEVWARIEAAAQTMRMGKVKRTDELPELKENQKAKAERYAVIRAQQMLAERLEPIKAEYAKKSTELHQERLDWANRRTREENRLEDLRRKLNGGAELVKNDMRFLLAFVAPDHHPSDSERATKAFDIVRKLQAALFPSGNLR